MKTRWAIAPALLAPEAQNVPTQSKRSAQAMKITAKKHLLAALCVFVALTTASQTSQAAPLVFDITGVPQNGFTYGTAPGDDNVVNSNGVTSTGSTVVDTGAAPSTWLGSGLNQNNVLVNSFVSVSGSDPTHGYTISWTYVGSESDNTIQFAVPTNPNVFNNGAITTNDDDRNNSCTTCQPGHVVNTSTVPMGSTTYFNDGTNIPAFALTDISGSGGTVTNGGDNPVPKAFGANLIFSYANFDGSNYTLTSDRAAWVVFAFNDNGFGDDDHDDFVGVMGLVECGGCVKLSQPTPLPAALPLFATGLCALGLLRWRRKRQLASYS
jgi:hypothetical protein